MLGIDNRVRRAGWISLRVIGAVVATIAAMTSDARIDARRDGHDAMRPDRHAGGPWCMVAFDRDRSRSCGFSTFDGCLKAVEPLGGACRPDPAALLSMDDGPYRTYRSIYQ